jgi:hypothetical protein
MLEEKQRRACGKNEKTDRLVDTHASKPTMACPTPG